MAIDTLGANALASNSVTTAKIANDAVTGAKIPADAVVAADIADGSITTAKLAADAVTDAKLADNAVVTANVADGAVTQAKTTGVGAGKNVIINGAMNVAQRGTSSTGLGASSGYFVCDRWYLYQNGTAGRLTLSQDNDAPEGFSKSLKFACTTADTSIASGESLQIMHKMEAQNLQQFKKGTSSALPFALSFYVKGNASATYVAELEDYDNSSRHVGKTFNVTTSWNRVSIIFPADTTGALGEDNGTGIALNIHLHSGSFNTGGTLRETWGTLSQADRVGGGKTSFFDSTNRTFSITGVKLEPVQVTDFEHLSFAEDIQLCKRYYESKYYRSGTYAEVGFAFSSNSGRATVDWEVEKRANPSVTFSGSASVYKDGNSNSSATFSSESPGTRQTRVNVSISGSMSTGSAFGIHADADWYVRGDSEL